MKIPFSPSVSRIATILLLFSLIAFVYGHLGSPHLNPAVDYISNYAARANRWPWICAAIISFGLVLFGLAYQVIRVPTNRMIAISGISFAVSATSMVFVACYPTARLANHGVEDLVYESGVTTSKSVLEQAHRRGWDKAYSNAHFDMIRVSTVALAFGMGTCALGLRSNGMWETGSKLTYITVVVLVILFAIGRFSTFHGLFQRLGFSVAWLWVIAATWNHHRDKETKSVRHVSC